MADSSGLLEFRYATSDGIFYGKALIEYAMFRRTPADFEGYGAVEGSNPTYCSGGGSCGGSPAGSDMSGMVVLALHLFIEFTKRNYFGVFTLLAGISLGGDNLEEC